MLLNPDQLLPQEQEQQTQQQSLQPMAHHQVQPSELDPAYAQFRDQSRFWIQRVAVPLLMVIGIFGNSITVIIMTRRRMRSTTNMYLAALAFVDMLYLVLTFLLGLSHYPNMAGRKYYAYWRLRPFLMMLTDACSNTSVWLTVTFTIERYIAVKYPMKGKVWCTEARAKILIVCVFMFGIIFASPVPFEWKVIEKRVTITIAFNNNETPIAFKNEHNNLNNRTGSLSSGSPIDHANNLTSGSSSSSSPPPPPSLISDKGQGDVGENDGDGDDDDGRGGNGAGSDGLGSITGGGSGGGKGGGSLVINSSNSNIGVSGGGNIIDRDLGASLLITRNDTTPAAGRDMGANIGGIKGGGGAGDSFILTLDYSDFGKNETYKTIYYWSTAVIFYFIPLFSLMLFNGFLIKSVHQSKRERTKLTRHSTTSSNQSSTPKADINAMNASNGSESDQALIEGAQKGGCGSGSCVKTKLLHQSSGAHRAKKNPIPKDSSTMEESSQSSPLLEYSNGNSLVRRNNLLGAVGAYVGEQLSPAVPDVISANRQTTTAARVTSTATSTAAIPLIDDATSDPTVATAAAAVVATTTTTIEIKAPSELNVQINCDNESVSSKRAEGKGPNEMSTQQLHQQRQLNNSMDPKETIKTIGLPQARHSPLRRSQMTNSSSRSQQSMAPASTQERRITIMLIAVVILFLVCQIPSAAMLLYTSVHELVPNTNEHALVLAFGNIFNFLMAVNAAGNFILYSFLSKKYRRTFMILFCSCLGSKRKKYTEPKRVLSVRFEPSGGQLQRNSSSIYQTNKTSDKIHRDTLV